MEIIVAGIFKGLGRTYIPSSIITILTGCRIPLALVMSRPDILGLNGVWWSVTLSSIAKGTILLFIILIMKKRKILYPKQIEDVKIIEKDN